MARVLRGLSFFWQQLQPAFDLPQRELPGAPGTEPEVLYFLVVGGEAKKPAPFQPQKLSGTLRVGTL